MPPKALPKTWIWRVDQPKACCAGSFLYLARADRGNCLQIIFRTQLDCRLMADLKSKSPETNPIAIIGGTGDLGPGLALRLAAAGLSIVIGSRDPERAVAAADEVREAVEKHTGSEPDVKGLENSEAAKNCSMIILTVPYKGQYETLKGLAESLEAGDILVDTTSPLETAIGGSPLRTLEMPGGSVAELSQKTVPEGVRVVSAMHTVGASGLKDLATQLGEDVFICGDDVDARNDFAEVISSIDGLRPIDCGKLEMARITERMTSLMIGINKRYKVKHSGLRVTGLPENP